MDMFSNVAESFSNNLIVEDRYRMILDGLQVHLINRFIHLIYVKGCYFCEKFHSLNQFYKFKTKSK